jgi:hypothetical protein
VGLDSLDPATRNNDVLERHMYSSRSTRSGGLDKLFRWGDHVCHFFRSADDLGEILIPYFKVGLERNEFCVWVTSHPYGKARAASELRSAIPDFDRRTGAGQLQILDHDEWYAKHAALTTAEKIQCWLSLKDAGAGLGYSGLRCSGNTSFLDEGTWEEFLVYERAVDEAFRDQPIIALCSYEMDSCPAGAVADVLHCHQFGLAKGHGRWRLIEGRSHDHQSTAAAGHDCITTFGRRGGLRQLIEDQLAIYIGAYPERIALKGGHVQLSELQATKLGPLFNELVINATRFGALSSTQGKLVVQWRIVVNGSRNIHITWTERGISSPTVRHNIELGTQLIAGALQNCRRAFDGMECTFNLTPDTRSLEVWLPFK